MCLVTPTAEPPLPISTALMAFFFLSPSSPKSLTAHCLCKVSTELPRQYGNTEVPGLRERSLLKIRAVT